MFSTADIISLITWIIHVTLVLRHIIKYSCLSTLFYSTCNSLWWLNFFPSKLQIITRIILLIPLCSFIITMYTCVRIVFKLLPIETWKMKIKKDEHRKFTNVMFCFTKQRKLPPSEWQLTGNSISLPIFIYFYLVFRVRILSVKFRLSIESNFHTFTENEIKRRGDLVMSDFKNSTESSPLT